MSQFTSAPSTTMTPFQGAHGDYVQVTAGQHSEPVVCTASTGVPPNTSPFGVPSKTIPSEGADAGQLTTVTNATGAAPQPTAAVAESLYSPPAEAPVEAEKAEASAEVPLPPPPPPEEEEQAAAAAVPDLTSPRKAVEEEEEMPPPPPPCEPEAEAEGPDGHSTGASLFGVDPSEVPSLPKEEDKPAIREAESPSPEPVKSPSPPPPEPVKMSTGDAIFADLPTADVKSTGASIFGTSEESAANTTGATLFEVGEPKAAQPALGAMSGWDDAFDRKFDSGGTAARAAAADGAFGDAFGASGAAMFVAPPAAAATFGDLDGFGSGAFDPNAPSAKLEADLNNPFLNEAKKANAGAAEDGDEILFDDDTSKPLEPFPRVGAKPDGWEFYIRHPPKKKGISATQRQVC